MTYDDHISDAQIEDRYPNPAEVNYLDLFSGIGGFALGAHMAGFKCDNHFFSDIEKFPVELYQKRFPEAVALGDITKIDFEQLKKDYPGEWVITGGFPCQDISIAGKGVGLDGERSGLWFEMFRAISILRPKYVIAENVGAITFRGLPAVLGSLASIGYSAEWQDIRAEDVGAPHRRERVWIVAYPRCKLREPRNSKRMDPNSPKRTHSVLHDQSSDKRSSVSDSSSVRLEGNPSQYKIHSGSKAVSGALLWDRKSWNDLPSPKFCRSADGIPNRVDRLKGCGNSIVPQIAQILFTLCMEAFDDR